MIFDYRRPGLDGAEICRRVRAAQPGARHVFLTGTTDVETVYQAVQAGADRVLSKPVDPMELIHILEGQTVESA